MKRLSRRKKNFIVLKQMNDVDKIINFFMNSNWSKTGIFVKLTRKVSMKWKNWSDFKGSTFDTIARRKLVEDQDTILELTSNFQELQNEINCMNVFPRYQSTSVFPTSSNSWRNAKPFFWSAKPPKMGRQAFGTHMVYRETFLQIQPRPLQQTNNDCRFQIFISTNTPHQQRLLVGR